MYNNYRTHEERECRRRLVQFWRRHESNNIFCTFKAVPAADRVPNSIVVSCIYWEEKHDFFVTSVDCIHLLESLIAVRFTVEEKNRIRRNLEGFRPLTVSKCKAESADFFKLIMSFPNPKPRNIEKDVKVFPWRILPLALKKIIGKYTASYSSTASITLDAYPTSRTTSYAHQPDGSLATTGGMAAFSPCQSSAGMLGGSSASAAIVAAAAASSMSSGASNRSEVCTGMAKAQSHQPLAHMSASGPLQFGSSSAKLAAMLETRRLHRDSNFGALEFSATSAAHRDSTMGMGMDVDMGMAMGLDLCAAMGGSLPAHDGGPPGSAASISLSIPARDSPAAATTNPLLMLNEMQRGISRSAAASYTTGNDSMVDHHRRADTRRLPMQSSSSQFDFSGMVIENPAPFADTRGAPSHLPMSTPLIAPSSVLSQLAAGYGLSSPGAGQSGSVDNFVESSGSPPGNGAQKTQQRVMRGSSTKRSVPHTPYNIERGERHRESSNCSNSDFGLDGSARSNPSSRDATSFGSPADRSYEHEASPSVPLILEQQPQFESFDLHGFGAQLNTGTFSATSTMSFGGPVANGGNVPCSSAPGPCDNVFASALSNVLTSNDFNFLTDLIRGTAADQGGHCALTGELANVGNSNNTGVGQDPDAELFAYIHSGFPDMGAAASSDLDLLCNSDSTQGPLAGSDEHASKLIGHMLSPSTTPSGSTSALTPPPKAGMEPAAIAASHELCSSHIL
ncbi:hypothetical protein GGI04_002516 [Coemansia thaxteri]|nr:hypothetical protein GGI04_002516 [Coemansia thaxteri]